MTAIECRQLSKSYPARPRPLLAVDRVDLELRRGRCLGLLGQNGAGKTTLVEMLVGLRRPDTGSISLLGSDDLAAARRRIGVALQQTVLPPKLTCRECLALFASFYRTAAEQRDRLERMGLADARDRRVEALSGGQRRRLGIACSLVCQPELVILDEPTAGVDPVSRRRIWQHLQADARGERSVLLTTHSMEEAAALCDQVAIMQAGRIIAQGDPRELVHRFSPRHRIRFRLSAAASIPADRFRQLDAVTSVDRRGDHFELSARDAVAGLAALLREVDASGAHLHDLEVHSGSLEDVFVQLTEADDANA